MTDPRNISPRTDAFLSIIGPYIAAIEHYLHDAPFLVKGLTLKERDEKMSTFLDYHTFIETDYSRFDMTISYDWIKLVQDQILLSFFPNDDKLARVLQLASDTFGISDLGMCYQILGTRCSGDAHTSIANGLINHFNTWAVFNDLPFHSVHEGDDGLIALPKSHTLFSNRPQLFDCFGFTIKSDVYYDIDLTSFCGRYLYTKRDGHLGSYCDPLRTLAKFHITLSHGKLEMLLLAKALSYNYTDGDTPIIGPVCAALIKQYGTKALVARAMGHVKTGRYILADLTIDSQEAQSVCSVTEDRRNAFAIRTGISPATQKYWEEYFCRSIQDLRTGMSKISSIDINVEGLDREVHYLPTLNSFSLV